MRTLCKVFVVLAMVALLASPVLAQRPGFGGPLVTNKSVQEELKLDQAQIEKVTAAVEKVRKDSSDLFEKLRDRNLKPEERAGIMRQINEAYNKPLGDILKKEQMQRYQQIQLQQGGVDAFSNPDVQKALKLSDDQKSTLKGITEDFQKERRELFQGGFNEETQKKMAALTKDTMTKAVKILKDDQKKTWEEMVGKPFEVKFERRPGGGGGR